MAIMDPLRLISQRLNATSNDDLPRIAGLLAAQILNYGAQLKQTDGQRQEEYIHAHRLKTRVLALLQEKTPAAHFAGAVLLKAIIDAAGVQILTGNGGWTRHLLGCLSKTGPLEVKKIILVTISRIFLLSKDQAALVRELTSPVLPSFIAACINLMKPATSAKGPETSLPSPMVLPVLQCWRGLIRAFPSTFRPHLAMIKSILLSVLNAPRASRPLYRCCAETLAALNFCVPKNTAMSEWRETCHQIIEAVHQSADQIFRAVVEEWTSPAGRKPPLRIGKQESGRVSLQNPDSCGLGKWSGMHAGCSRVQRLISVLEYMAICPHANPVALPISSILDMTARLTAVTCPSSHYTLRHNPEIDKNEREDLWTYLPEVHLSVLVFYEQMVNTYGRGLSAVIQTMLSQIWDVFDAERFDCEVRAAAYRAIEAILSVGNGTIVADDAHHLSILVKSCTNDLGAVDHHKAAQSSANGVSEVNMAKMNLHTNLEAYTTSTAEIISPLELAAQRLLTTILTCISTFLPSTLRAEIDRTLIFTKRQEGLIASVLNPPPTRGGAPPAPSLLPFLARADHPSPAREALLRPRMPYLPNQATTAVDTATEGIIREASVDATMEMMSPAIAAGMDQTDGLSYSDRQPNEGTEDLNNPSSSTKRNFLSVVQDEEVATDSSSTKRSRANGVFVDATLEGQSSILKHSSTSEAPLAPQEDVQNDANVNVMQDALTSTETGVALETLQRPDSSPPIAGLPQPPNAEVTQHILQAEVESSDDDVIPTIDPTLDDEDDEDDDDL